MNFLELSHLQRRFPQLEVLPVGQGLAGCDNDGVSRVYPERIKVLRRNQYVLVGRRQKTKMGSKEGHEEGA